MPMNDTERAELLSLRREVKLLQAQMDEVLYILSALTVERPALQRAANEQRAVQ